MWLALRFVRPQIIIKFAPYFVNVEHLDIIQSRLQPELAEMNAIIHRTLATENALMDEVVSSYLKTKGKQIRPIMVLLSAKMFGGEKVNDKVLYAAAALEMLHNASLIHDDVVDETTLRRGQPTINSIWGNHLAVLVGDYFVSNALAAGIHTGHISIIAALSDLGKELSLGEIDQICNVRHHDFAEESYLEMIRKKTASLFRNCVRMGAEAVGTPDTESRRMVEFAELLGMCFQIKDDIFDYFSDPKIGKPTGNDLREGKVTLPLLYALRTAPETEGAAMRSLLMKSTLDNNDIACLIEFAKANGGIDYAFSTMRQMQTQASELIASYPESPWKQSFVDIFDFIISRDK